MSDKPIVDELEILPDEPMRKNTNARTRPGPKGKKPSPPYREGALVDPLAKLYGVMAIGLMPMMPRLATTIMSETTVTYEDGRKETLTHAEYIARCWDEWAKTSPAVRRILYPLINVSGGAKVFAAHLPLIMAGALESGALERFMERFFGGSGLADQAEAFLQSLNNQDSE